MRLGRLLHGWHTCERKRAGRYHATLSRQRLRFGVVNHVDAESGC